MKKAVTVAVAVVAAIYLLAGLPILSMTLDAPPIFRAAAIVHFACAGIALLGCIAAVVGRLRLAKWLALPAMALVSLVVAWPQGWIVYPSFLTVPLTVVIRHGDGTTYWLGVNAMPAVLLIALAFSLRVPRAPREEPISAGGVNAADSGA